MRKRADIVLVERGFFSSRARAQAAIAAGLVSVGGVALRKASDEVAGDAPIEAEVRPLPMEETTPPVTRTNFVRRLTA